MNEIRSPLEVKKYLNEVKERNIGVAWNMRRGDGVVIGNLNKGCGDSDIYRRILLGWLFNRGKPISSKELKPEEWHALREWATSDYVVGKWVPNSAFLGECKLALEYAKEHIGEVGMYEFD